MAERFDEFLVLITSLVRVKPDISYLLRRLLVVSASACIIDSHAVCSGSRKLRNLFKFRSDNIWGTV